MTDVVVTLYDIYLTGILSYFLQYESVMRPNKLRNDLDFRPKIFGKKNECCPNISYM